MQSIGVLDYIMDFPSNEELVRTLLRWHVKKDVTEEDVAAAINENHLSGNYHAKIQYYFCKYLEKNGYHENLFEVRGLNVEVPVKIPEFRGWRADIGMCTVYSGTMMIPTLLEVYTKNNSRKFREKSEILDKTSALKAIVVPEGLEAKVNSICGGLFDIAYICRGNPEKMEFEHVYFISNERIKQLSKFWPCAS